MIVISILVVVLMLGIMVIIHELGHFISAKLCGVKVNEFSIGMGPRILKKQGKETLYSLKLFPIGGSVQMEGEEEYSESDRGFNKKPVWKRFIVVTAGAIMNIILGFIIMVILISFFSPLIPTTQVAEFIPREINNVEIGPFSNSESGLMEKDIILKINGKNINISADINYILGLNSSESVDITVKRDGNIITLNDVKFPIVETQGQKGMLVDFKIYGVKKNPINVISHSFKETVGMVKLIYRSIGGIITGQIPVSSLSGIVGVTGAVNDVIKQYKISDIIESLLYFMAMITINLGIFNLLPFPALDGGHVVFLLYESIRKKPAPEKLYIALNAIGFGLLILLMIAVTFKDVFVMFFK